MDLKFCEKVGLVYEGGKELTGNAVGYRNKCKSKRRLDGRVVVITGANQGIGKETALQLSLRGAKIIIGCRDLTKAENAIKDINETNPKADIKALKLDLVSLKSVREFARQVTENCNSIDILINNAGVNIPERRETDDGLEYQFGVNHLAHFLLTLLLLPLLRKASTGRVVNVASSVHRMGKIDFDDIQTVSRPYNMMAVYGSSKLAQILFTRELARRLGSDSNVNVYALHPGGVRTELAQNVLSDNTNKITGAVTNVMSKVFLLDIQSGAQTSLYCAIDEAVDNETGLYYENCRRIDKMWPKAIDDESAKRLWDLSVDLVKLEDKYNLL
ncbi:retinol dehydrogenase 13-like [Oppia nitens]|uniref:retinol dehydrogenase 13-like n=1 Tax=Oppia nitens TaxID=1686743 RepID=UPI0023DC5CE9|nr:retinol dehydrogenase 13-like [Oppia nitens]